MNSDTPLTKQGTETTQERVGHFSWLPKICGSPNMAAVSIPSELANGRNVPIAHGTLSDWFLLNTEALWWRKRQVRYRKSVVQLSEVRMNGRTYSNRSVRLPLRWCRSKDAWPAWSCIGSSESGWKEAKWDFLNLLHYQPVPIWCPVRSPLSAP